MARSRLISLKRKLNSNPTLLHEYDQIIKDYLKNNIIEVNENEVVTSTHYLHHHTVIKSDREITKTRILFDVSAKSDKNEPSLNDILYSGPCFLPLVEDILLQFWHNDIFDENSLKVYRFGRVLFVLTCSPFLLNGTVRGHSKSTFAR